MHTLSRDNLNIFIAILLSFLFVILPWEQILILSSGSGFSDRSVYIELLTSDNVNEALIDDNSGLSYFFNEYFWRIIVFWFSMQDLISANLFLSAISFALFFLLSILIIKWVGLFGVVFLFNPLIVDLCFSQSRLALSLSILIISYLIRVRMPFFALFLCFISPLIHTAAVLFILIYLCVYLTNNQIFLGRMSINFRFLFLLFFGLSIAIISGPARELILSYFGDRRAEYSDIASGGLYVSIWILLLVIFYFIKDSMIDLQYYRYSVALLSVVLGAFMFEGYANRFIAVCYPFVVASIFSIKARFVRFFCISFVSVYILFQWLYWLRIFN